MPKIIDKDLKKQKIVSAAISVFAHRGFANTKMADIAVAAGIGKGTIYEYFKSKDEIFKYAYQEFMNGLEKKIATSVFKITDPVEKLRALFLAWADILSGEHQHIMTIMIDFWAEAIREKADDKIKIINMEKIYSDYRKICKAILDEGIQQGKIRKVNTYLTASILLGAMDGIMLQWILDPNVFKIRDAIECLLDEFLTGICFD